MMGIYRWVLLVIVLVIILMRPSLLYSTRLTHTKIIALFALLVAMALINKVNGLIFLGLIADILLSNSIIEGNTNQNGDDTTDEGTNDEGTTSEGTTSEGTTSEGTTSEGTTSEGTTSEGTAGEGTAGEGATSESTNLPINMDAVLAAANASNSEDSDNTSPPLTIAEATNPATTSNNVIPVSMGGTAAANAEVMTKEQFLNKHCNKESALVDSSGNYMCIGDIKSKFPNLRFKSTMCDPCNPTCEFTMSDRISGEEEMRPVDSNTPQVPINV